MSKSSYTWPLIILSGFLIVFAFNFFFAYQAHVSNVGPVEDDTYNKGLNYQEVIDSKKKSNELDYHSDIQLTTEALYVTLKDKDNNFVDNISVEARVVCLSCTDKEANLTLTPMETEKGTYAVARSFKKGLWRIIETVKQKSALLHYRESRELLE